MVMRRVKKDEQEQAVDNVLAVAQSNAKEVEEKEELSVTFNAEEATNEKVPVAVKLVRVATNVNHTCVIGGKRYTFTKGVCQNVPTNVKDILMRAGMLQPL